MRFATDQGGSGEEKRRAEEKGAVEKQRMMGG